MRPQARPPEPGASSPTSTLSARTSPFEPRQVVSSAQAAEGSGRSAARPAAVFGAEAAGFLRAFLAFARWRAAWAAALAIAGAAFEGVGLLLLVPMFDTLTGAARSGGRGARLLAAVAGPSGGRRLLVVLAAFAAVMLVRAAVLRARDRAISRLQLGFVEEVRLGLVERLAAADWSRTLKLSHARIAQALGVEMHQVGMAVSAVLLVAVAVVMLAGFTVLGLALAPLGALVAGVFAGVGVLASGRALRRARALGRAITQAHFGMTYGASALLDGLKVAAAQGLQAPFVAGYRGAAGEAMRDRLRFADLQTDVRNSTAAGAALVAAVMVLVGAGAFHMPASVLITLLVVLVRVSSPLLMLQQGLQQLLHSLPSFALIAALERELAAPGTPPPGRRTAPGEAWALRFVEVSFAYADRPILERVDLAIPAGAFVGVTGPSGAGKTTFLDLAAGLLAPTAGCVFAEGEALSGEALRGHRARLAYVGQDPVLFDDTIRRNLAWAQPGASDREMHEALELAGAAAWLARLERALDTRIGERGVLISAGERQRLALARALLRCPKLLILDEATNALDLASERAVLQALAALRPRATILMSAHRPESLAFCDHLLTFPDARLTPCAGMARAVG